MDIEKLHLVDAFLSLGFDLHTTDFVFAELDDIQQEKFISDKLKIIRTETTEDYTAIFSLYDSHKGLSIEDCSVWHYTKKLNGILITGDGKLRKHVSKSGITVKGIIFIIEELKNQNILSIEDAIYKIRELKLLNIRLPHAEIDNRIVLWEKELNKK